MHHGSLETDMTKYMIWGFLFWVCATALKYELY